MIKEETKTSVKIYTRNVTEAFMADEQGEFLSLEPWGKSTVQYKGYDDGGKDYALPDGFTVGNDSDGVKHIYDDHNGYLQATFR